MYADGICSLVAARNDTPNSDTLAQDGPSESAGIFVYFIELQT